MISSPVIYVNIWTTTHRPGSDGRLSSPSWLTHSRPVSHGSGTGQVKSASQIPNLTTELCMVPFGTCCATQATVLACINGKRTWYELWRSCFCFYLHPSVKMWCSHLCTSLIYEFLHANNLS